MKKIYILMLTIIFLLPNCAAKMSTMKTNRATIGYVTAVHSDLISLPKPQDKIVVAVYKFRDQTGQYKSSDVGTSFSTMVTQGATSMLIKALEDSKWFISIEREGLPNLLNERQIIRSTRQQYQAEEKDEKLQQAQPLLPPLLYAGVLLEGGIISYETNIITGGMGAKYFGLGGYTQARKDQVTIYLRAISTQNGRVLKSVSTTKSVLSKEVSLGIYRFVRVKRLLEIETGLTMNEPPQMCVLEAIEKAVFDLIVEGLNEGLWVLQNPKDINSPLIQGYLKEKAGVEREVTFDKKGNLISPNDVNNTADASRRSGFGFSAVAQSHVSDEYSNPKIRPAGEFLIRYGISPRFSLMLNTGGGQLADKDNFKTTMVHVDFKGLLAFSPYTRWTPYVFVGGSIYNFWAKSKDGAKIERNQDYFGWRPAIVSGIGTEYFINKNLGLNIVWNYYYTFNDQLDGKACGNTKADSFWSGRIGFIYYF